MDWSYVNYLNYGSSPNALLSILDFDNGVFYKDELIDKFRKTNAIDKFSLEIIRSYHGEKTKRINLQSFKQDLKKSLELKNAFSSLGCRGFSSVLHGSIDIDCPELDNDVNLKIALMPDEKLFYPPRIRRYFRRHYYSHYRFNRYPSICFALGKLTDEACCIIIMQSDFVHRNPSFIRDHFRGWRKILMKNILEIVKGRCNSIYLPIAHDVLKCCHPEYSKSQTTPQIWFNIYDRTAVDFNFSLVCLNQPINIQLYRNLKPMLVQQIYKLNVL